MKRTDGGSISGKLKEESVDERMSHEIPEDEARVFLEYMSRERIRVRSGSASVSGNRRGAKTGAARAGSHIEKIDLEGGRPGADEAVHVMEVRLKNVRAGGACYAKLVHGYGSSGRGGAIRGAVRSRLAEMKREKLILDYVPGEDFGAFSDVIRAHPERISYLSGDIDYGKCNPGITIVVL